MSNVLVCVISHTDEYAALTSANVRGKNQIPVGFVMRYCYPDNKIRLEHKRSSVNR